ncbi:hypothetical protein [uncultured Tenacibaculum sp.]|uniref:hypothetical protein n=1 Tax=uncultured Tenacibaculum sp. TaxID=174713 RepID=UPI0026368B87|nr:hypothetical protein [uncultured Tenacibaculum sp.]
MKKINKNIFIILILSGLLSCSLSSQRTLKVENKMTLKQFDEKVLMYCSMMESEQDFNEKELTIILKLYNTIYTFDTLDNNNYKKYIHFFKDKYMSEIISKLEFKISKGMGLYSEKKKMHIFPSSKISTYDTYIIGNGSD